MTTPTMQIEQTANVVVARLEQEQVTHLVMQELVVELMEHARYNNAHHFVIDLAPVEFLSSACIGVLVGFMQDIEHAKGRIVLSGCQPNVAFLFKVTKLDTIFPLFEDVESAVDELQGK
jgi:anti-sigma B factor antagonist